MSDETSFYILFHSHTEGMALYSYLKERSLNVRISPAPRETKTCCGMSLLVSPKDIDEVRLAIDEGVLPIDRIVELTSQIDPKRDRFC